MRATITVICLAFACWAQEADSGFELRSTMSAAASYSKILTDPPRNGSPLAPGFRLMLYPTWKLNRHWTISGTVQAHSRPYFPEQFSTQGNGIKDDLLQLSLNYSHFWGERRSIVARVGQLSSAFGSFLQRYDPKENSVIGLPYAYGYYYKPVTFQGLAGAEVDLTAGKFDARAQLANSSPANRRSVFDSEQYGSWASGAGYTIRQGLRVGGSAYTGPYLHREYAFYFPGEAPPRTLTGRGYGFDAQWGWRHLNVWAELQRFVMDYRAIPPFKINTGYVEARFVLSPRWFAATRVGYLRQSIFPGSQSYELGGGFRPSASQLIKFSYTIQKGASVNGTRGNIAAIEFVTSIRAISWARR